MITPAGDNVHIPRPTETRSHMEVGKKVLTILAVAVIAGLAFTPPAPAAPSSATAETVVDPELRMLVKKAANDTDSFRDRFDGEVWLADMSQRLEKRVPDPQYRVELLKNVHYEAHRSGLPPELVLAVIDVESNFSQYAISRAGARGLMQVMPFWLDIIGKPGDSLFRIQTNLRLGCTILKYYLNKEQGNLQAALKRYNGTSERTYAMKVDRLLRTRWFRQ